MQNIWVVAFTGIFLAASTGGLLADEIKQSPPGPNPTNWQFIADAKADPPAEDSGTKAMHGGILPLDTFGGDLSERRYLLGDWSGLRTDRSETRRD